MLNVKNKAHALTADLSLPPGGANGVVVAQGGAFGGWSIYLHQGHPAYHFTGRIHRVQIDLGDDSADHDHLISPADRVRIVTARQ